MDKFSELKVTIPADKKSRESVAAGYVTDNNSGGYFVIECQECGAVYPSQQADGGGQIADTGDYNDAICPHCGEEGPEECENVGLAWNVQQAKIIALLAELEASKQYAKERDAENESLALTVGRLRVELHNEGAANAHAYERIRELEKRLSTPVRLQSPWVDKVGNRWLLEGTTADAIRASGFAVTVEGDE